METAAFQALEQESVLHGEQQPLFRTGASDLEGQIQTDPCSSAELIGSVRQVADIYLHKRANFKGKSCLILDWDVSAMRIKVLKNRRCSNTRMR